MSGLDMPLYDRSGLLDHRENKMDKIIIENLSLQYSDGMESLRDVSLNIREKAVTVLFGPAGGGKSTLLRCINRLNDLTDK